MNKITLAVAWAVTIASPALAQTAAPQGGPDYLDYPSTTGAIVGGLNNTGGNANVTIPRGATGAETFQSDSAAAGNANQPARAVPQGSGGGGNQ